MKMRSSLLALLAAFVLGACGEAMERPPPADGSGGSGGDGGSGDPIGPGGSGGSGGEDGGGGTGGSGGSDVIGELRLPIGKSQSCALRDARTLRAILVRNFLLPRGGRFSPTGEFLSVRRQRFRRRREFPMRLGSLLQFFECAAVQRNRVHHPVVAEFPRRTVQQVGDIPPCWIEIS